MYPLTLPHRERTAPACRCNPTARRRPVAASARLAFAALWLAACASGTQTAPDAPAAAPAVEPAIALHATPAQALVDEPIAIRATGLQPGERVWLRAHMTRWPGSEWAARVAFEADADGAIDPSQQAPVAESDRSVEVSNDQSGATLGSYQGVAPMGLIWSMQPLTDDWAKIAAEADQLAPVHIRLTIERGDGEVLATAEVTRLRVGPDVVRRDVATEGLVGTLFLPPGAEQTPAPAVLVLGGSEGGLRETTAALLASRGYAALALAYFGVEGLPKTLERIPLEYFATALTWMQRQPSIDGERIAVQGISRGGELALLLGATYPHIRAVAAYVPSGVTWPGIGMAAGSAWTLDGQPVPFASWPLDPALQADWMRQMQSGEPLRMRAMFASAARDPEAMRAAEIAVERIQGPILLVSGKDDQIWPSTDLAEIAVARLKANGHRHGHKHLAYDDAGHLIVPPYFPATVTALTHPQMGMKLAFGGTAAGNAHANRDAWEHLLTFLRDAL